MALIVKDRVQEISTTVGTGTLTLGGATLGFQSFAAIGNGNTTYYAISDPVTGDWEVGIGTYTSSGTTLSRDTVLSSSNSGSLVSFAAGTKNVFCTYPSERAVYLDSAGSYPVQNVFDTLTADTATLVNGTVSHIPAVGTDIANKAYVDTTSTGLTIHEPVVAASTSNLTATYADGGTTPTWTTITNTSELATGSAHGLIAGAVIVFANVGASGLTAGTAYFVKSAPTSTSITLSLILDGPTITTLVNNTGYSITSRANSGVGATLTNAGTQVALEIDGVALTTTQRVLIQGQTTAFQNGVYTVTTVGSGSTNWVLTRSADEDTYSPRNADGAGAGDYFFVTSGNTSKGDSFVLSTSGTIVFGTTSLVFSQFSESNVYSAGTGLTLNNLVFSITNTGTAGTYGGANSVPVFTTNAQGQVTSVTPTSISISAAAVSGLAASATTDTTNASNITSGTLGTSRLSGSYTGITGVGTLTAGTWNANTIAAIYGGTGLTSFTAGDLIYANSSTTLASLADVAVGNALISGGVGADPSWGKIGLATHVSGTLPVANGGTNGTATPTAGAVAYGTGSAYAFSAAGTSGQALLSGATGAPTWGTLGLAAGGSGQTTAQAAMNAFAGAVTSGSYLRGNGTNVVMSAIQVADVPTLNQNTTGSAATLTTARTIQTNLASTSSASFNGSANITPGVTGTLPIANGGTGQTTAQAAMNSFAGAVTSVQYLRGNGTNVVMSAIQTADVPTLNQNTTGNAATATTATNQSGGTVNATTGAFSGALTASAGGGAATSTYAIQALNGGYYLGIQSRLGAGSYNPLVQANDTGLIFTAGSAGTGSLFIGPWSASSAGLRMVASGDTTLNGNFTAVGSVTASSFSGAGTGLTGTASSLSIGGNAANGISSGTVMLFAQTAAPTGWTKSTAHDNKALRVVSGTASSGGSVAFTTAFASQAVSGSVSITGISGSAGATTLTTPQIPSHVHGVSLAPGPSNQAGLQTNYGGFPNRTFYPQVVSATGGGGSHDHPFSFSSGSASFSGTAINLAVQYVDVIIATKN
jgi:hypothetical protein